VIFVPAQKKQDVIVEDGAVYVLRAGTPVYVKTADICAMTGKSNQWIGQLVSQGTLNKRSTPYGAMFDQTAAMRAYCDDMERRADSKEKKALAEAEKDKLDTEIVIKKSKAVVAKLEARELLGKMHRSEDVAAMTEDLIYAIRGMLVALPGRLAVDAAGAETPAEASETIRQEVYKVMDELSRYRYDPAKYEERVRERKKWSASEGGDPNEEQD
jgi:hypothetical protein